LKMLGEDGEATVGGSHIKIAFIKKDIYET
jgi:hypothetical protein